MAAGPRHRRRRDGLEVGTRNCRTVRLSRRVACEALLMASDCEPLSVWLVCLRVVGRWCVTAAVVVAELFTGGISGSDAPARPPRRRLYGYVFSHSAPSAFKNRAREHRAWSGDGLFRLGHTEGHVLVSRSGWVVSSVEVGASRSWLWWTLQAVSVDGECLTLMARRSTAAVWMSA